MAQRRTPARRSQTPGNGKRPRTTRTSPAKGRPRKGASALPIPHISLGISAEVARSLVGIFLLGLGAVTLIALALPGEGSLTDWWRNLSVPFFGTGRWLLPPVLLIAGWYVEWGPGRMAGAPWGRTLLGIALAYTGLLGLVQVIAFRGQFTGGRIGRLLVTVLEPLLTTPGAFVVLAIMTVAGLLIAFDVPLRTLVAPLLRAGRALAATLQDRTRRDEADVTGLPATARAAGRGPAADAAPPVVDSLRRGRGPRMPAGEVPGQIGVFGQDPGAMPTPVPTPGPVSSTFAPARYQDAPGEPRSLAPVPAPHDDAATDAAEPVAAEHLGHVSDEPIDASRAGTTVGGAEFVLPPRELLDRGEILVQPASAAAFHERNRDIIKRKLASLGIEAEVIGENAGPVVTQYVIQPAPHVKLSRIEALTDDLAMALAARSIRIEAPIPGKSAVGIEIPNAEFNVVALGRILDEVNVSDPHVSRLTFALGRDVAGRAQAVDLARMPHLLIAGATGSGKSVMVNALITSLLCNAGPREVRMILMDLKRVELASYSEGDKLPHLLVPVITEPEKAKAALLWAVDEMERRYKKFAAVAARNIKAYNESAKVPERRRLPYIVIVIDELADLMMREGKNVEDPIVRLAQKARATGIHMVLATQRPSVNVVTGLIKANFPSRIAFAMASQIDSRTILDQPGAEDLIGRGDMLYQPSDVPRPIRHQGVFVSDNEIAVVVKHWCDQVEDPRYEAAILLPAGVTVGNIADDPDEEGDKLLMDAVGVIREYDRASASLLQRRLRIGYARAARIIDQLESRGYVGAFDGSNARPVLRRDDGSDDDGEDDA